MALENHADLTADELLRLVETAGTDIAGVTLDTGNLVLRLDDPIEATELLAPLVLCTHVKDAVLAFTDRGLCWQARPVGSGIMPITEILARLKEANPGLNLSIDLHPRTDDLPIFDRAWLAHFPDLDRNRSPRSSTWPPRVSDASRRARWNVPRSSRRSPGRTATSTGWPTRWATCDRSRICWAASDPSGHRIPTRLPPAKPDEPCQRVDD